MVNHMDQRNGFLRLIFLFKFLIFYFLISTDQGIYSCLLQYLRFIKDELCINYMIINVMRSFLFPFFFLVRNEKFSLLYIQQADLNQAVVMP